MPRDASRDDVLAHLNKLHAYVTFRSDFPHSSRTISHCTSPFNLRLQFFKSVECNGADTNVVKDAEESTGETRFFKVRIGPAYIWPAFINGTQISMERVAGCHYAFYHKPFLEFVNRLLH